MKALILAGGSGTRLLPLTADIPKPILPIAHQTLAEIQINLLQRAGITDIIFALGDKAEIIKEKLGDGAKFGVKLSYLIEREPRGTAGAYKFAQALIDSSTLVLNGDILTDIDLSPVIAQHTARRAAATIVLTKTADFASYGIVEVDENHRISSFSEKPPETLCRTRTALVNSGIYILEPLVLQYIPAETKYSFEHQLFPALIAQKEHLYAHLMHNDYWRDIGTPERYLEAHRGLLNGEIRHLDGGKNFCSAYFRRAGSACRSIIGEGCRIAPSAEIVNSVLGENVTIENGARVVNSVIMAGTKIDCGADISESIIGKNCFIGKSRVLSSKSILGSHTKLL